MARHVDPFVAALDDAGRREFTLLGHTRRYGVGETVFLEGDKGATVLAIQCGRIKVTTTTPEGHELVLGIRGPNELIGELSSLDESESQRSASAIALTTVVVQVIRNAEFLAFLERYPQALLALIRAVVGRLHNADRRRLEFGAYDTTTCLARLLSELASTGRRVSGSAIAIDPSLTQHELAGLLGTSRESVVRALSDLRRRKIIETGRRRLVVLDVPALTAFHR